MIYPGKNSDKYQVMNDNKKIYRNLCENFTEMKNNVK